MCPAGAKHQSSDALPHMSTTTRDDSLLEEDIPVLKIIEAQPEREKTNRSKLWLILPARKGLDTLKLNQPEVLRAADGTGKE